MSVEQQPMISYSTATADQILLMDRALGLVELCEEHGGKLKLSRGDTGLKVTADRARLLVDGEWQTIVVRDEDGELIVPASLADDPASPPFEGSASGTADHEEQS